MANQITGKVIAFSDVETIASSDPKREPFRKRKLYIDCTRYDPYTGERDKYENTPLLEFGGKVLEDLEALIKAGLKKDDVVDITFDIQGTAYKNRSTGKQDVFTRVRPYKIELHSNREQAPTLPPAPEPTPAGVSDGLPF